MTNHLCQLLKTDTVLPLKSSDSQPAVNVADVQVQQRCPFCSNTVVHCDYRATEQQGTSILNVKVPEIVTKFFDHKPLLGREIHFIPCLQSS